MMWMPAVLPSSSNKKRPTRRPPASEPAPPQAPAPTPPPLPDPRSSSVRSNAVDVPKRQLDILALEPFYGGGRKAVLDALTRYSRHRWTVLKLPARKIERRLLVAATWFAEHLSRNNVGQFDMLVTSEALNLADLFRLVPELAQRPSVVYFHDNQLPDPAHGRPDTPVDLVNLNSAMAAGEVWFNSVYNLKTFLGRAARMVARHAELASRNPMPGLTAKSQLMSPPIELKGLRSPPPPQQGGDGDGGSPAIVKDPRALLIDARDADPAVVPGVVAKLVRRKEEMTICTIGQVKDWPDGVACEVLQERDEPRHVQELLRCGIFVTLRGGAAGDDLAVRSLAAGCYPVFPQVGLYPELVPDEMHKYCLHDGTVDSVTDRILDAWYLELPGGFDEQVNQVLSQFDAIRACKAIDERLEAVLAEGEAAKRRAEESASRQKAAAPEQGEGTS
jgi:hypothetical protein